MSNMMTINTTRATSILLGDLHTRRVPLLLGAPGIGKSAIYKALAKQLNLKLVDVRLAQHEPTDLVGFPMPNAEAGRMNFLAPSMLPLSVDHVPDGYDGWLLFLDELPQAAPAVQNAALRLVLDRQIGEHKLHDKCLLAAAGNRAQDGAFAGAMSTALMSRMSVYELELDFEGFMDWATHPDSNMNAHVLGFLHFRPDLLHKFDPTKREPFPCPRAWETVSAKLNAREALGLSLSTLELAGGPIGIGAAVELSAFIDLFSKLPRYEDVVGSPSSVVVPSEPDLRYAIVTMLAGHASATDVDAALTYVERMPKEFHMLFVKMIARKTDLILASNKLGKVMVELARALRN